MNITKIDKSKIQSGDILLCYSSEMLGKADGLENGYSHAAICLNSSEVVESASNGVQTTTVDNLFEEYLHIALLRNNELWSQSRIQKLCEFANDKIGKKFNLIGVKKYPKRKETNQEAMLDQVKNIHNGTMKPLSSDRNVYFCSELVTSAFIHVGIIDSSATVCFRPEIFSPEDIGKDKAFGFFIGYILPYEEYEVPENDFFRINI